ncbi:hypothetical protein [Leekyejoonella antrihumi]|uniref:Uncharacterized protein n=1 Tax=Leekyejoonella antrihumi TaxID=1660198 RepID=A0A563DU79_9MICO|nr:hypothetical protein [Leekyejoonella antrihumi]TWP33736.1 hypothetical protein FGL98_20055 [Leekyejoonella antrihumi]
MPDVTAALSKSDVLWIELTDRTWPAWHVWVDDTAYVVCGTGEQPLPDLPAEVTLIVRAKDTRARVAGIPAAVHRVLPDTPEWQIAADALAPARLNPVPGDQAQRWADQATVWALRPDLAAADTSAAPDQGSGTREPVPTPATTDSWHPAHRPTRRMRRKATG